MGRYRSLLASILALVMVFLTSCGSPKAVKPPVYDPVQLEKIDQYQSQLLAFRDRMTELESLIQQRDWNNVSSLIHGPLGQLRQDMSYITRSLLPQDKKSALNLAREIAGRLEAIDVAGSNNNLEQAISNYRQAIDGLDTFTGLLSKA
ncbi:MAG: photosystem II protein PsbQ [Oscillatoria sp. SIO1A7]|nr:photosystem II protein PsbQ [Oscillatoria sp. SIO1A7]